MGAPTTTAKHTHASLSAAAEELENHMKLLRASAALLILEPKIEALEVRNEKYGLEAAQASLGHRRIDATQIYAQAQIAKAKMVATKMG